MHMESSSRSARFSGSPPGEDEQQRSNSTDSSGRRTVGRRRSPRCSWPSWISTAFLGRWTVCSHTYDGIRLRVDLGPLTSVDKMARMPKVTISGGDAVDL